MSIDHEKVVAFCRPDEVGNAAVAKDDDDYSSYPVALNERRANTDPGAWSPREMLIKVLRDLDSGALPLEACIISFLRAPTDDPSEQRVNYMAAGSLLDSVHACVGLLEVAKTRIMLGE